VTIVFLLMAFLLATAGVTPGFAQEAASESRLDGAFLRRFGRDLAEVITGTARWDGGDFLTLAAVSGSGLFLMAFDQKIQDWTQARRDPDSDRVASFLDHFGNGAVLLGIGAAIYGAGEIGHDDGLRRAALLSVESLTAASLLVWAAKVVVGRARPYTDESSGSFHPFALKNSFWSFPSGHAAAAFAVATAIALQSSSGFVDVVAYSLAGLAGLSRIHENSHWASDVFIGSALGFFVAKKIAGLNRPGGRRTVGLQLRCSPGRQAVTLNLAF
jgi:membrane-associated phospholipid phosphatase